MMKRCAYVVHWNDGPESGVFKKLSRQVKRWTSAGLDVKVFLLSRLADARAMAELLPVASEVFAYDGFTSRFAQADLLAKSVRTWNPDLVYHRYDLYYPAIARLAREIPFVLEINTDDMEEYKLGPLYRHIYNRLTRSLLFINARGMVFVSDELSKKHGFERLGKPGVVIANGIDLDRQAHAPAATNHEPRLVFMSSPGQPWQGVEKILWLAGRFPAWKFDLIGMEQEDLRETPPENLKIHGFLPRAHYEKILASADVAIGTLSLYLKSMDEASPLKVREYLAYGLPVIIGYRDTDFPQGAPFLLVLPNSPSNVREATDQIAEFVKANKGKRVDREMVSSIDDSHKEERRLAFFEEMMRCARQ